ncbi:hypothetical protein P175DRAFT_06542 [Aspergillus ochraceoroseus IBT 24754]|uniref:Uncharacterized protein n=1 Tax=Aspergillus ochraceoroseus IBT 24754 TaxID=1392256 RepID=A0A2T5M5K5_9EURO|nr:uncharacterized protein P175DRAFT_06542 [Aspergillus ochraceoroseus IBT 24754]PTU23815.1 hypothetical protein P175DRAFT_06542 [Aspergillus ochraceoroseus IBT 24754]
MCAGSMTERERKKGTQQLLFLLRAFIMWKVVNYSTLIAIPSISISADRSAPTKISFFTDGLELHIYIVTSKPIRGQKNVEKSNIGILIFFSLESTVVLQLVINILYS